MSLKAGIGKIVTDGLVLCLDAADPRSYPRESSGSGSSGSSGSSGTSGSGGSTWYDRNMYQYNGTISGATFTSAHAKGAFYFNGVDNYITIPFGNNRDISTDNVSYDIWVKSTTLSGSKIFLINSSKNDSSNKFYLGHSNTEFDMGIGSSDWESEYQDVPYNAGFVEANVWFNFCLTVNGTTTRCYKDGKNIISRHKDSEDNPISTSFTKTSTGVTFTQNLHIGGWSADPSYAFNGYISCLKVYNRTLSADEVLQNYRVMQHRHKRY